MKKLLLYCVLAFSVISIQPVYATQGLGEMFSTLLNRGVGKISGKSTTSRVDTEQALVRLSDQINKQSPMVVDKETRWDNTTPGPGLRLTHHYTFVNFDARDIDTSRFIQTQSQQVRQFACSSNDMKVFLKHAVTIAYSYKARDGVLIGKVEVAPRDCGYKIAPP